MDWLDVQRLLTSLILPLPLGLGLSALGLVLLWRLRSRWAGALLIGFGVGVITLSASPLVAERLMGSLEAPYPPLVAADCPKADAIVLLGGAMRPRLHDDWRPRLHRGSDRIWEAARLYHAGCAPLVVVSAGGGVEPPCRGAEIEGIAELLGDLGVPREALLLEAESRNTQGNAAFSRAILEPLGADRVLLVTSAWHLRRAVALFEREGFEVVPVGADYRSFQTCGGLGCFVPSVDALEGSGLVLKERLGLLLQGSR
jgi:uncharacterized SAM-binding protein YcdF (DUF218 family)